MRFRPCLCAALCLLLCAAPDALIAESVLEPGVARAAAAGPQIDELLLRIMQAADAGSSAGLTGIANEIAARSDLHPAARDRLLRELALALARVIPDGNARGLIAELAHRPPGVRVWLRESHPGIDVLLYDVAAAARYTSRRWVDESDRRSARVALEGADLGLVDRFAAGDDTFRKGIVAALDDVPLSSLHAFRDPAALAFQDGAAVDALALALALALRLRDRDLATTLALHGDAALVVHALPRIRAAFTPADALAVLESALSRPALASAVLFEIGRLAAVEPRAREVLFAVLDEPGSGGSAAAALARLDDAAVAWELGRRLESGESGLPERRALLALRLSDSDAARAALDRFMRSSGTSATLRREAATGVRP